jgi:hypothetical protein
MNGAALGAADTEEEPAGALGLEAGGAADEEAAPVDALGLEDAGADEVDAVLVALGAVLVACGAADEEVFSWLAYLVN